MRDDLPRPIRLADYQPPAFRIEEIALDFALDPARTRVAARSQVRRVGAAGAALTLDGADIELAAIRIDGRPLPESAYRLEAEQLVIPDAPDAFTLEIETILQPERNTALEGLYVSNGRFCTQCESEGFRKITYFLDRPDVLSRYTVRIEADATRYPTLLANGDLIEQGALPNGRHYAVWRDPFPKPSYLFALVAGAFDILRDAFVTRSGKTVDLAIHVDLGDGPRAAYAMDSLKRAMRWDEEAFGREYDLGMFNIVAVRDFNFGAMENKGLNIFNSAYVLADGDTATDADFEAIESIVGHEYFHNWTGNRITLRDWFQLCLKEGLTVFRDQEFSADQRSRPVQRIKDVRRLRARQFPEDAGPLAHPVRPASYFKIDNFYTATVYEKGAEVIRMLEALIGPEAFARGMDLYFDRCDGTAATVEDFLACFAEAANQDLSAFALWYAQAGTPRVKAALALEGGEVRLSLAQSTPATPGQPRKAPMPIPLRVGFLAPDGAPLALVRDGESAAKAEHLVVLDQETAEIKFTGATARPIPALLRGFSAPVQLEDDLTESDRLVQMAHDPDPFTRWEAGQNVARALILEAADGGAPKLQPFVAALSREADRAGEDPAFAALALRLPDLAELVQIAETPDPDALHHARELLRSAVAAALEPKLLALLEDKPAGAFSPDAASAGARALRAAALDLLSALGEKHAGLLARAFADAADMGGRMAALEALSACDTPHFDRALETFYARFKNDPLVVDKWFALQAAAPREDTLARVEALRRHPDFDLRTPNRVRALAGVLPARNPRAFHAADGAGYRWLAQIVGEIDANNPALAARLLGGFESFRKFDAARQAEARGALEALLAAPNLSRNLREMLDRTLG